MVNRIIERILRDFPETRNSDKRLILKVWESQGLYLTEAQAYKFFEVSSPETIRRVRQKIQESGKYQADPLIRRERRFKSYRLQQITPQAKPQYVEQALNL